MGLSLKDIQRLRADIEGIRRGYTNASILQNHKIYDGEDDIIPFLDFMDRFYRGGTIVEIGTKRGVSAAVFAMYAPKVITFDVDPLSKECHAIWEHLAVTDRIEQRIVKGDVADVSGIDATFAFIDGNHAFVSVMRDFNAVRHVGTVLFHDYNDSRQPGVTQFVDSLLPEYTHTNAPYALWSSRSDAS